jgi:hypothetical protein
MQLPSLLGKKLGGEIYEKFSRLRGDEGPSILHVLLLPLWKSEEHWGTIRVEKTRVKKSKMADVLKPVNSIYLPGMITFSHLAVKKW